MCLDFDDTFFRSTCKAFLDLSGRPPKIGVFLAFSYDPKQLSIRCW